jgi:hypothetical protein
MTEMTRILEALGQGGPPSGRVGGEVSDQPSQNSLPGASFFGPVTAYSSRWL